MTQIGKIQRIRRTIADFILGDDTVFFTNGRTHELLKDGRFLDAPDEAVGKMFKHFWSVVARRRADEAVREGRPFRDCMMSGSVLYLASEAAKVNSDSTDFTVSGSIDGGKTEGAWAVRIESDPNYKNSGGPKVEITRADGDPEKIIGMSITTENPSYQRWKNERTAQAVEAGTAETGTGSVRNSPVDNVDAPTPNQDIDNE